jgi:Brp/Blh family beta-carotene 15,15'-monooxygenase
MIKILMLLTGALLSFIHIWIFPIPIHLQTILFLIGILLLGIPHGAADMLVANKTTLLNKKPFNFILFLFKYLSKLFIFAMILWWFPVIGNLLFILIAAYHFGETDLHQFNTQSISGKLFVLSYGLVILSVILINNFDALIPLFNEFESGRTNAEFISWISNNRYFIMSIAGFQFFIFCFAYFVINPAEEKQTGNFLFQFAFILLILFNLPMLLGFSFYFIFWHSVLALKNIVNFLKIDKEISSRTITKQIFLYSILAIMGIAIFGSIGFMFSTENTIIVYVFLGLAVLTAPHLPVMHQMYNEIRRKKLILPG